MIPTKATKTLENAPWTNIDGQQLDKKVEHMRLVGAEPISYPLTDGVLLYMQDGQGRLHALQIGADLTEDDPQFEIKIAHLPYELKTSES
jgi:hypothetical protein